IVINHHKISEFKPILFGTLLIVMMIAAPEGITGLFRRVVRGRRSAAMPLFLSRFLGLAKEPAASNELDLDRPAPTASVERPPIGDAVLEAHRITVSFGGVRAVDEVDIAVRDGEILGLIGPNGSGKSTLLNAITGVVPAAGSLRIRGADVRLGRAEAVVGAGVYRTYQTPQRYLELSCIDNVLLSTTDRRLTGVVSSILLRPLVLRHERARWRRAA